MSIPRIPDISGMPGIGGISGIWDIPGIPGIPAISPSEAIVSRLAHVDAQTASEKEAEKAMNVSNAASVRKRRIMRENVMRATPSLK